MNRKLQVVIVTNNPVDYPRYAEASIKYPELVKCIDDECEIFIVDMETSNYWPDAEFFHMAFVTAFLVNPVELT